MTSSRSRSGRGSRTGQANRIGARFPRPSACMYYRTRTSFVRTVCTRRTVCADSVDVDFQPVPGLDVPPAARTFGSCIRSKRAARCRGCDAWHVLGVLSRSGSLTSWWASSLQLARRRCNFDVRCEYIMTPVYGTQMLATARRGVLHRHPPADRRPPSTPRRNAPPLPFYPTAHAAPLSLRTSRPSEPAATQLRRGIQVLAHPPRLPAFSNSPTPTLYSWRTDAKAARFPEPWYWPQERVTLHKFPAHYNLFVVFLSPLLA
ncbi:hypothetical protein C8Q76DRAFT_26888 [Earliella scabrosa]|nr:hypothetical protein C8Q76DRAFT_26888 [Earliella scabrosa]